MRDGRTKDQWTTRSRSLRKQAAKLGANGVLLGSTGERTTTTFIASGSVLYPVPVTAKTVQGRAIFVKTGRETTMRQCPSVEASVARRSNTSLHLTSLSELRPLSRAGELETLEDIEVPWALSVGGMNGSARSAESRTAPSRRGGRGSYSEAAILTCAALSALSAEVWPGRTRDRVRFIELLARLAPPSSTSTTISIPLLAQHLESTPQRADARILTEALLPTSPTRVITGSVDRSEAESSLTLSRSKT
jgi:hypothetical protein